MEICRKPVLGLPWSLGTGKTVQHQNLLGVWGTGKTVQHQSLLGVWVLVRCATSEFTWSLGTGKTVQHQSLLGVWVLVRLCNIRVYLEFGYW